MLKYQAESPDTPSFGFEFDASGGFDINAAFQEALFGVVTDAELALEEKVQRMETIVDEGTSEIYRDFIDFRAMAVQMEMMCSHDHALGLSLKGSDTLSRFMDSHNENDGHDHGEGAHDHDDDDEYEIDARTGKKKKKKKRSWFGVYR